MAVSSGFQPAAFTDSNRAEKVMALAPRLEEIFRSSAEKNNFPGMVYGVVLDGKLVWQGSYGVVNTSSSKPVSSRSLFKIASMTKSFTAMAIIKLAEEGKVSLNAPASLYVPELSNLAYLTTDAPPITLHHLLTMTAGFPEDNPWGDRQLEDTPEELQALIAGGLSFSNVAGYQFEYSNTGFAILGQVISNVAGMPYQQYINESIFKPLGMNNTYWEYEGLPADLLALGYRWEDGQWKVEPMLHDGAFGCMGGLITSLDDFSKYVAYHLSAYPPRSDEEAGPVRRNSLREMHKPYMPNLFADARDGAGNPCPVMSGYGYGLGYRKDCNGQVRISHSGGLPGFGSEYRFYPEYGLGIIAFANRTYAGAGSINNEVANLIFKESGLLPFALPASEILVKRQNELKAWLTSWDSSVEEGLFAENFFLDFDRERRIEGYKEILDALGNIQSVEIIRPFNQLRGTFTMVGEKGKAEVFFTLSPEKDPKVQQLDVWKVEE